MEGDKREEEEAPPLTISCTPWLLRLCAWVVVFTAFVLSAAAVNSCRFVRAEAITYGGAGIGSIGDPSAGILVSTYRFGLYRFDYDGTCVSYGSVVGDLLGFQGAMKVARAMGALSPLLGGIAMLVVLASFFFPVPGRLWQAAGGVLFLPCTILQSLAFAAFATSMCDSAYYESDVSATCKVDKGAKVAIAAIIMYMIAGVAVFLVPAPGRPLIRFKMAGTDASTKPESIETRQDGEHQPEPDEASAVAERSMPGSNNTTDAVGEHQSEPTVDSVVAERSTVESYNATHEFGDSDFHAAVASVCSDDEKEQYITATVNSDGSRTLVVKNGLPSERDSPISSEV